MQQNNSPMKQILSLIGAYFSLRIATRVLWHSFQGFKSFILPSLWPRNFVQEYGSWAVITGCTRGIGYYYAKELAARNMNLLLIGRNTKKLNEMKENFENQYGVTIEIVPDIDFSSQDSSSSIYRKIEKCLVNKDLGILVNNIGSILAYPMFFNEMSEEDLINMIKTNIVATSLMTKLILPKMEEKGRGAVINIASVSGLSPQPLQTVYAATKAYVDFFSRGLNYEYGSKGITVQTICPSYVCTEMTSFSKTLSTPSPFVPLPEDFVCSAVKTIGYTNYTTGFWSHALMLPFAYMPRFVMKMNERFRSEAISSRK